MAKRKQSGINAVAWFNGQSFHPAPKPVEPRPSHWEVLFLAIADKAIADVEYSITAFERPGACGITPCRNWTTGGARVVGNASFGHVCSACWMEAGGWARPKPPTSKPPRYDAVYAAGVAAMDAEEEEEARQEHSRELAERRPGDES